MIRFILGLILVFGGVGSIESNPSIIPGLTVAAIGIALLAWSIPFVKRQHKA